MRVQEHIHNYVVILTLLTNLFMTYFKHDSTVASLLCGLGIEVKGQPFTASCILLEVYQETDGYEKFSV